VKTIRKFHTSVLLSLGFVVLPGILSASQVLHHPCPSDELGSRWNWAVENAQKQGLKDGCWIGYSIKRLMGEYTYLASTGTYTFSSSYHYPSFFRGKSLGEIVYGYKFAPEVSDEEQIKKIAKQALNDLDKPRRTQRKIWKDVSILFRYGRDSSRVPEKILFSNLSVPFDQGNRPLFWLDKAEDAQSFYLLSRMYKTVANEDLKRRILSAIGIHSSSDLVVPFLEKVLKSKATDRLRGRAAVELGEHDIERSLKLLLHTAREDHSLYVRKRAVSGLEDLQQPAAADALIELACHADSRDIRRRAISALGDIASRKAVAALEEMVYSDEDTEIQKRAVYALEDLPNGEGIPYLIKIAKTHPKLKVRKSAIYCLGDSDDSRALNALIEIIRKK